ncbi:hypothetical protein BVC80_441g219 [Macleaya cordata]|uniref:F-box associated beta-propeller type 3 domain-containing protein n=1 Tax=Macleaya cordata TaxID=56857 RepID=A0A200Q4P3_MACCD|nr:hypothetical protein BVC80_441g219 [Macleaya cordata]
MNMGTIPHDVVFNQILSRLPYKYQIRCSSVFIVVFNHSTDENIYSLPMFDHDKFGSTNKKGTYGFGFDSVINKYKVVRVLLDDLSKCLVYTLGTHDSSARVITTRSPSTCRSLRRKGRILKSPAIFWNEASICWKTDDPQEIILFHLQHRKFQVLHSKIIPQDQAAGDGMCSTK